VSHHVGLVLPDGRHVLVDYRAPIVPVMHRCLKRIAEPSKDPAKNEGGPADLADKTLIAEWIDVYHGQVCTSEQLRAGCPHHPPATREPYKPPPYKRGQSALF
jgi:hypothetical protein